MSRIQNPPAELRGQIFRAAIATAINIDAPARQEKLTNNRSARRLRSNPALPLRLTCQSIHRDLIAVPNPRLVLVFDGLSSLSINNYLINCSTIYLAHISVVKAQYWSMIKQNEGAAKKVFTWNDNYAEDLRYFWKDVSLRHSTWHYAFGGRAVQMYQASAELHVSNPGGGIENMGTGMN